MFRQSRLQLETLELRQLLSNPTVSAVEGQPFSGIVAEISIPAGAIKLNASIDWNVADPNSVYQPATIDASGDISGTYTYTEEGSKSIDVIASYTPVQNGVQGQTVTVYPTNIANITDAPLSAGVGFVLNLAVGQSLNSEVASFGDSYQETTADYTANINWGDNSSVAGTIGAGDVNYPFGVYGAHAYKKTGHFTTSVAVYDDPASTQVTGTAIVNDPTTVQGNPFSVAERAEYTVDVALVNMDQWETSADYSASITWGDDADAPPAPASISSAGVVTASYAYQDEGTYTASITVYNNLDGLSFTVTSTATVTDPPLSAGVGAALSGVEGESTSGIVAHFSDPAPESPGDYSAAINWGDGTSATVGTVQADGNGFIVDGSHTYAEEGNFQVAVAIQDGNSPSLPVYGQATIADAPLSAGVGSSGTATEGEVYTGTVATFSDQFPEDASEYSATINWGDGTYSSAGTISSYGKVTGTHTYEDEGHYPVSVIVFDTSGGQSVTIDGSLTVNDAPLQTVSLDATGLLVSAVANQKTPMLSLASATATGSEATTSDIEVTVYWGDNTETDTTENQSNNIQVMVNGGQITVEGQHEYQEAGTYLVWVSITDTTTGITRVTSATATVVDNTVTLTDDKASPLSTDVGAPISAPEVANFSSTSTASVDNYDASVDWGDGSPVESGTVVENDPGSFSVVAENNTHTYDVPGTFLIHTHLTLAGTTATLDAYTTVTVLSNLNGSMYLTVTPFYATEGTTATPTLAQFSASPNQTSSGLAALVNYGDGGGWEPAQVTNFSIVGNHTYATMGDYLVQIELQDGTRSQLFDTTAVVKESPPSITVNDMTIPYDYAGGQGIVAQVQIPPSVPVDDYTVKVNWGNGAETTGSLVRLGNDVYVVADYGAGYDWYYYSDYYESGWNYSSEWPTGLLSLTVTLQRIGGDETSASGLITTTPWSEGEAVLDYWYGNDDSELADFKDERQDVDLDGSSAFTATVTATDEQGNPETAAVEVVGTGYTNQYTTWLGNNLPVYLGKPGNDTVSVDIQEKEPDGSDTNGYDEPGTDPSSGSSLNISTTYVVADAPLKFESGGELNGSAGVDLAGATGPLQLATFSDSDPTPSVADYTAMVDFGDGTTPEAATIVPDTSAPEGSNEFIVEVANHTYAKEGQYTINIMVWDQGGATLYASAGASIDPAAQGQYDFLATSIVRSNDPDRAYLTSYGNASIAMNTGGVRISQQLDFDLSPGTSVGGDPRLSYNSDTTGQGPIVEVTLDASQLPAGVSVSEIDAELDWNGVQQPAVTLTPGQWSDQYILQLPVSGSVDAAWGYDYSADLTVTTSNGSVETLTVTGTAPVTEQMQSQFGQGWGLSETSRIIVGPDYAMRIFGTGDATVFAGTPLTGYTSPANDFGSLTLSNNGGLIYTDTHQNRWFYSGDGQLLSTTDRDGVTTDYGYDYGLLSRINTPDGGQTTFNNSNSLTNTIDEPGSSRTVTLGYSGQDLASVTDADQNVRQFNYSNNQLSSDTWGPLNTTFTYNNYGAVTNIDRGNGDYLSISPAATTYVGNLGTRAPTAYTETPYSEYTTVTLDALGRITHQINNDGTTESWMLDDAGDPNSFTDQLGLLTTYNYDRYDDQTGTDYPDGTYDSSTYDPIFRELTSYVDAAGHETSYQINPQNGDTISMTDPLGTTQYFWTDGLLTKIIPPDNDVTMISHDQNRRVSQVTNVTNGDATTTTYDINGNPATSYDINNDTTYTTYDNNNLLTSSKDPNGNITTYSHNAPGDQTSETLPDQEVIETPVNAQDEMSGETDGAEAPATERQSSEQFNADDLETLSVDPVGNATQTVYNSMQQPVVVTTGQWNSSTNSFTGAVRVTYYQYDKVGHITLTVQGDGSLTNNRATQDDYNNGGRVYRETVGGWAWSVLPSSSDSGSGSFSGDTHVSYFQTDGDGNNLLTDGPTGLATQTTYNGDNLPTQVETGTWTWTAVPTSTSPGTGSFSGTTETTSTNFDAAGRATGTTDALLNTTHVIYNDANRTVLEIDGDGNALQTLYDHENRVAQTIQGVGVYSGGQWSLAASPQLVTQYSYDSDGNLTQETIGTITTDFMYDSMNLETARIDNAQAGMSAAAMVAQPSGHQWIVNTSGYNEYGDQTSSTNGRGKTTNFAYDNDGEKTSITDPKNVVTKFAVDAWGDDTTQTDDFQGPQTEVDSTTVDAFGEETQAKNALNESTTLVYNAFGFNTQETDANNQTTTTTFNNDGQPLTITDAKNDLITDNYDSLDRLSTQTTPAGETQYTYDLDNRMKTVTQPGGGVTTYNYDADGNITSVQDADGNITTLKVNYLNLPTLMVSPTGQTVETYDTQGRLSTITDGDGREKIVTYNDFNWETQEVWKNAAGTVVNTLNYTYDDDGNLLTAGDSSGTYTFTYDDDDYVSTITDPNGITLSFTYDDNGNVKQITDSQGGVVSSTYDLANQLKTRALTGVANPMSVAFTYDNVGQETQVKRYNDGSESSLVNSTNFGYDKVGNITSLVELLAGGGTIASYANVFDGADRLTSESRTDNYGNTATTSYTYDSNSEVTGDGTSSYGYDANGNRNTAGYTLEPGTGNNRIASDGTWNYSYDAVGNVTQMTNIDNGITWVFTYSLNNQMLTATEYTSAARTTVEMTAYYTYDVFGDLINLTDTPAIGASTVTCFAYNVSGASPGIDNHVNPEWAELDSSGTVVERFLLDAGGNKLARSGAGLNGNAWLLLDQNGSLREVLSASGVLEDVLAYTAFGQITQQTSSAWTGEYTFTGLRYDAETNILWAKYRGLLSDGQWNAEDQTGFAAGDSNLRRYVGNDGENEADGSGLADDMQSRLNSRVICNRCHEPANNSVFSLSGFNAEPFNLREKLGLAPPSPPPQSAPPYNPSGWIGPREFGSPAFEEWAAQEGERQYRAYIADGRDRALGLGQYRLQANNALFEKYVIQGIPEAVYYTPKRAVQGAHDLAVGWNPDNPVYNPRVIAYFRGEIGFWAAWSGMSLDAANTVLLASPFAESRIAGPIAPVAQAPNFANPNFIGPLTLEQHYARAVLSNCPWSWARDIPGGATLSQAQRAAIRQNAFAQGLISPIPLRPGTQFLDTTGIVQRVDNLPQNLWTAGDTAQFRWLDARIPGGRPAGMTWHHSEIPGQMELVPFGPHNVTPHIGGRSPGMWADAPR